MQKSENRNFHCIYILNTESDFVSLRKVLVFNMKANLFEFRVSKTFNIPMTDSQTIPCNLSCVISSAASPGFNSASPASRSSKDTNLGLKVASPFIVYRTVDFENFPRAAPQYLGNAAVAHAAPVTPAPQKFCMAIRRKFSKSTVRYTINGDATFNPKFVSFELLLAGDAELNPGDAAEEITQLKLQGMV